VIVRVGSDFVLSKSELYDTGTLLIQMT